MHSKMSKICSQIRFIFREKLNSSILGIHGCKRRVSPTLKLRHGGKSKPFRWFSQAGTLSTRGELTARFPLTITIVLLLTVFLVAQTTVTRLMPSPSFGNCVAFVAATTLPPPMPLSSRYLRYQRSREPRAAIPLRRTSVSFTTAVSFHFRRSIFPSLPPFSPRLFSCASIHRRSLLSFLFFLSFFFFFTFCFDPFVRPSLPLLPFAPFVPPPARGGGEELFNISAFFVHFSISFFPSPFIRRFHPISHPLARFQSTRPIFFSIHILAHLFSTAVQLVLRDVYSVESPGSSFPRSLRFLYEFGIIARARST